MDVYEDGCAFADRKTQWNAVALWAWDIVVDNCAICRNHIMDLCTADLIVLILSRPNLD